MLPVRDQLPTRIAPAVNYAFIALNVVAFCFEVTSRADVVTQWALIPAELVADPLGSAPTLLTHMFLHGGVAHIAGNMLFLWIFGDNVEDALGHVRYALFYLTCGLVAALTQVVVSQGSRLPVVGASGAIAGVLAAYGFLYPRSPITVVNPIPILWLFWGLFFYLPAWFVILEFFVVNLWQVLAAPAHAGGGGGVAFAAHVGGFVAGAVLLPILKPEPVTHDRWDRWVERRR